MMKQSLKNLFVLSLILTLSSSTAFCHCLTKSAHAKNPSHCCHQTSRAQNSSKSDEDCDCGQKLAVISNDAVSSKDVLETALLTFSELPRLYQPSEPILQTSSHASPFAGENLPLFIKNAVLRI